MSEIRDFALKLSKTYQNIGSDLGFPYSFLASGMKKIARSFDPAQQVQDMCADIDIDDIIPPEFMEWIYADQGQEGIDAYKEILKIDLDKAKDSFEDAFGDSAESIAKWSDDQFKAWMNGIMQGFKDNGLDDDKAYGEYEKIVNESSVAAGDEIRTISYNASILYNALTFVVSWEVRKTEGDL